MFARMVEFAPKPDKTEEIVKLMHKEVLPLRKKQPGFLEILPFLPENKTERLITITLWNEKHEAERYERETHPKVEAILKPHLTAPATLRPYMVETSLCQHFVAARTA